MRTEEYNENFRTPTDYFENQERQLIFQSGLDFKVPENYFENQEELVLKNAPNLINKNDISRKLVIAVSAAIIVIAVSIFWWNSSHQTQINNETIASINQVLNEVYLIESDDAEIEDMDLLESYFGEVATENILANQTLMESKTVEQKKESISEIEIEEENEATEILFDLYFEENSVESIENKQEDLYY